MNVEKTDRYATVREGYQILLRADVEVLEPIEKPKMRAFYRDMAETCLRWAQAVYGESRRKEFLSLDGIRERSQFGTQCYRLKMNVVWEDEAYAAVVCQSWLSGQWREPQKSYHRISHVWNLSEESILPISEILRRFGMRITKDMLPFRPDGVYPDGNELVFFRNVTQDMPFLEKRITRE